MENITRKYDQFNTFQGFSTRGTAIYKATKTATDVMEKYTLIPPIARVDTTNSNGDGRRRKRSTNDEDVRTSCSGKHWTYLPRWQQIAGDPRSHGQASCGGRLFQGLPISLSDGGATYRMHFITITQEL